MKITATLVDKLIRLRNGESLPASSLRGAWVEELISDGVLLNRSSGSRRVLLASGPLVLVQALSAIDERFSDLERLKSILEDDFSRGEQAAESGNSKLRLTRSCPGFLVNCYEPIVCLLDGKEFIISPLEGSFVFVSDWEHFTIPSDVIVVGIENMENFRMLRKQRLFFEKEVSSSQSLLFVSRYPQSLDLREWLMRIPNRYVHFGDFDLAGINIYLTEFCRYLGRRSSFLIPSDIGQRLVHGSVERYQQQYQRFRHLTASEGTLVVTDLDTVSVNASDTCSDTVMTLQQLIDLIHSTGRCYDQEGYIQ